MTKRIVLFSLVLAAALVFAPGAAQAQLSFHPLNPCRIVNGVDFTADGTGYNTQAFAIRPLCGIPNTAVAVAFNVTANQTGIAGANQSNGRFSLYPGDLAGPSASTINFVAGQNIANGAVVKLNPTPGATDLKVEAFLASGVGKQVRLYLDVTGYYE